MAYQKQTWQTVLISDDIWADAQTAGRSFQPKLSVGQVVELAVKEWIERRDDLIAREQELAAPAKTGRIRLPPGQRKGEA